MGQSLLDYGDVVISTLPNPDDPRLLKIHKKGFLEMLRSASPEEVDEWASFYPLWYLTRFRKMPVLWSPSGKKVRVGLPRLRSHRSDYYSWIRFLPLPRDGYWYLLTLTLFRSVSFYDAWKNINRWTSGFLHRFRVYLKTKYQAEISYLWVVEVHRDGYPHVHILFMMPYVRELSFQVLLSRFQSYWVDDRGNPLCAPQGVDLKYLGRNVSAVRDYLLKYLVKDHHRYWRVQLLSDGRVVYRKSSALIWLYKVRLFGMSRDIRAKHRERESSRPKRASDYVFYGFVSANSLHKLFYRSDGLSYEEFLEGLGKRCALEFSEDRLPILVPSAFSSQGLPSSDDVYDDLVESF